MYSSIVEIWNAKEQLRQSFRRLDNASVGRGGARKPADTRRTLTGPNSILNLRPQPQA